MLPLLVGLVVVGLVAGALWWVLARDRGVIAGIGGPAACTPLTVAAAPDVAPLVGTALAPLADKAEGCVKVTVTSTTPVAFAQAAVGGAAPAQVWIPDSSLWVESLTAALGKASKTLPLEVKKSVAQTPVVLGVPAPIATEANTGVQSWIAILASQPVTAADPSASTPSALAFTAVWQQLEGVAAAQDAMGKAFFDTVASALPTPDIPAWATKAAADARLFPATEQQLIAYNASAGAQQVKAMTPAEGPPRLDFPVVAVGDLDSASTRALLAVQSALTSKATTEAFVKAGFRVDDAREESVAGVPSQLPGSVPGLKVSTFDQIRADWARLSRDLRLSVVVDVSGSMKEPVGDSTRIALAAQAVQEALGKMNPTSSASLWVFSSNQRPGGVDYRELLPMAILGSATDPSSQAAAMKSATDRLPTLLQGDTGLYDTIWAAYENAKTLHTPDQQSIVIVVTDGKNDDPTGGMSEDELVAKLQAAQDPAAPVRLMLLGIGDGPDQAVLSRIATTTGGTASVATDPTQIVGLFADAVWSVTPGAYQ
ncbi:MAG: VWA domain-containing protein [Propionibacteriaceae bacterium]|nr:VWA domain-containing protein [Propionibacteriaceae bacterium]